MTIALFRRLSRVKMGLRVLRKYGSNAHLWLPGVGYINGQQLGNYLDSAGTTLATVDNPVGLVKDLITAGAINASQATTANKPTLRRGVTNLLLNSATPATQNITVTASPYTLAAIGTGSVAVSGTGSGTLNGGGSTITVLNFTPTAGTATFTPSGSVASFGLFPGTLTAAQIQACGGIPPTTSAAASSSAGNWGWQGNGTSTLLNLASPPGISNACAVVVGVATNSAALTQVMYGENANGAQFYLTNVGGLTLDKNGGGILVQASSVVAVGVPMVVSAKLGSGTAVLRKNGGQIASATTALTFSGTAANLMASVGSGFWVSGVQYPTVLLSVAPTDADLLAIERMICALTGPTGVTF